MQRSLVREEVYRLLHEWIVNGTLQPDEQMRDVELAEMLGVSRTPVREALRRLEDEGLVQTARNRWTRVAPVCIADAHNHFPVLWTLERLALELTVTSFSDSELTEMSETNRAVDAALQIGLAIEASTADFHFHQLLTGRCPNPEIARIAFEQKLRLRRISICYFEGCIVAEQSVREHQAIVDACRGHDHWQAAVAIERHWKDSYGRFLEQIELMSGAADRAHATLESNGAQPFALDKVGMPTRWSP
ncbi:MAG TPA: GntR family transcriptional regulator [Nitrolancea sp.]|jgi:DNA-binding GntR family transcriptional regulator|nr:GntR family transcriptional regulator [Nitrolancea sp.]